GQLGRRLGNSSQAASDDKISVPIAPLRLNVMTVDRRCSVPGTADSPYGLIVKPMPQVTRAARRRSVPMNIRARPIDLFPMGWIRGGTEALLMEALEELRAIAASCPPVHFVMPQFQAVFNDDAPEG